MRQILIAGDMACPDDLVLMRKVEQLVNSSCEARAWTLDYLRCERTGFDASAQARAIAAVADSNYDELRFVGKSWETDPFCLLLLRVADFCGVDIADAAGSPIAVSCAARATRVADPAEVCPSDGSVRVSLSELSRMAAPMPGVNRVRLVSDEGKILEEGYYACHLRRDPAEGDLVAGDFEHFIVYGCDLGDGALTGPFLMRLVDGGIGAYLEVVRDGVA